MFLLGKNINSSVLFSIIFRTLLVIVLMPQTLFAADKILSAKIFPLNRLSIKLTELPETSPLTTLSSDKKTIVLIIDSAKPSDDFSDNKSKSPKTDFENFINDTIVSSGSGSSSRTNSNFTFNSKKNTIEKNKTKTALEYPKTEEERSEKAKELLSIMNEFTQKEENLEETKSQKQKNALPT